ncbi:MAG: hypothetical protein VB144_05840 [Clostridia bacterium]|nr:hypothetical protein [Clostridia bacterium]
MNISGNPCNTDKPGELQRRADHLNRVEVEVEATGGIRVGLGDRVTRGQDLGIAPDFGGRALSPVDGVVEAIGFNPGTHRFEMTIRVE